MKHIGLTGGQRFGNFVEHANNNRETRKNGQQLLKCTQYITDKDSKTHWNDYPKQRNGL